MSERIIFKEENEKAFWQYWQQYTSKNQVSPKYLKSSLKYHLVNSSADSLLSVDKSFIYLIDDKIAGIVFLPIEKNGQVFTVGLKGDYVIAPLFENKKKIERKIFNTIDKIALENKISKIMFSIDPLEKEKFSYNYLQKYNYLDSSLLVYIINIRVSGDLLEGCRNSYRSLVRSMLSNKDFSVFHIDKNNPSYEIHKEYELLHHKCSGKVTRPQQTFDIQYQELKQGNAVLFGLNYKGKNVAYSYFRYNTNKAIYASGADDPDYNELPLYHPLLYSAMKYFQKKGIDYIDTSQPSNPSTQIDYYPDRKQLDIGFFKTGFTGDFVENFRGVKYFSKKVFEKDMKTFLDNYKKTIKLSCA